MDRPSFYSFGALAIMLSIALFGFIVAVVRSRRLGEPETACWSGFETALTVVVGGLAARAFIWSLLSAFEFDHRSVLVVGWLFQFWPGLIDTLSLLFFGDTAFSARALLEWATVFGAIVGYWDGLHQIHDWRRGGGLTFLIDVTWAGAGVAIGVMAHFLNLGWGGFVSSRRIGAHRYDSGVAAARAFAITVGNYCGNLRGHSDDALFRHEAVHVLQNRLFGPLYLFSYVGWMAAFLVPALAWGGIVRRPFSIVFSWCYYNNPWEEWAYQYGGGRIPELVWPIQRILMFAIIFFMAFIAGLAWLIWKAN